MSPLNQEQACSARDALSKAIYGRTFTWLVNKINASLAFKVHLESTEYLFSRVIVDPGAAIDMRVWLPLVAQYQKDRFTPGGWQFKCGH